MNEWMGEREKKQKTLSILCPINYCLIIWGEWMEADSRLMGSYLFSNKRVKMWISEHNLEWSLKVSGDKKSFLWLYLDLAFLKKSILYWGIVTFAFKKNSLFFNWRIIALQNFAVFCQTSTWISHRYTYIPSLLNLRPISLPTPPLLGWYRAPVWVSWAIQQIPVGYLFYMW